MRVRTHVEVQVVHYFDRSQVATLATFSADRRQSKQTMGGRKRNQTLIGDDQSEFQPVFFQKGGCKVATPSVLSLFTLA